jgi:hypothetical protein
MSKVPTDLSATGNFKIFLEIYTAVFSLTACNVAGLYNTNALLIQDEKSDKTILVGLPRKQRHWPFR